MNKTCEIADLKPGDLIKPTLDQIQSWRRAQWWGCSRGIDAVGKDFIYIVLSVNVRPSYYVNLKIKKLQSNSSELIFLNNLDGCSEINYVNQ